ncbi:splicing factor, CC1-like protein, partial [Rhizodiscina lignyota]
RKRSGSPDLDRRHPRQGRHSDNHEQAAGDYYRGGGRPRTRSRSPDGDRYYRPAGRDERGPDRDRFRERDRNGRKNEKFDDRRDRRRDRRSSPPPRSKSKTPPLTEDERDKRTVFVQQLAARLRSKELVAFFSKVGPVKEAQIVKDRVSGRSKGVGYVEFKNEESVAAAIQLTGQKLLGIPIIAQLTEAEKNRQARTTEGTSSANAGVPFHRLYVGNIHFSITEQDLHNVFSPFGELQFVQLQKEEGGRSRGYGFVQFYNAPEAKDALEKMNGFDLAGRPIRVGLGNDKFTDASTQNLLQRFGPGSQAPNGQPYQGSAFSGSGGRGAHAGGSTNFDRAGGRDTDKTQGGASALDDTDVSGVNFNNFSRDVLMRRLAREDDATPSNDQANRPQPRAEARAILSNMPQASRSIVLRGVFDPAAETGDNWMKDLEDEIKEECERTYGEVVHVALDPNRNGDVYIKFRKIEGGEKAIQGLNGRYFAGRMVSAAPVVDAVYSSLFSRSKA